jgi:hypothetical protein
MASLSDGVVALDTQGDAIHTREKVSKFTFFFSLFRSVEFFTRLFKKFPFFTFYLLKKCLGSIFYFSQGL